MQVDLTLAVNYLPACVCLCKVLVFALLVCLIPPGEEVRGGYIPLAAMLYLDRLITRNVIFDANAILLAVYFANVHAAVRATSHRQAYAIFVYGLHLCWIGMCLTLLLEPSHIKWFLERRMQASRIVPVLFMLFVLVGTAYIQTPLEPGPTRACRALGFTLLAFAWIYVVGIHTQHGLEYLKETSCQFVVRLAPALYSPLWLAVLFAPAALAAMAVHHSSRALPTAQEGLPTQVVIEPPQKGQGELADDAQLFRQAKLQGRAGLDVIPE
jgi:tellurite resistance protein TehA-like permease